MITRLTLTDFLAHGHTVLEFGPGLTVLTGPNNTGKSAVVEALRCLCQNPTPKHFIRHGAKEARVEAEMDDGTRVAWIRTKSYSKYELARPGQEPETYAKFGRRPPQDVLDALRMEPVELETDDPVDVHIGNQRDPIFLLNRSGFTTASFLASSTESAHLLSMQKVLKDRVQAARKEDQDLAARLRDLAGDLDRLAPLPDLGLGLEAAAGLHARLEALGSAVPVLERATADLDRLGRSSRSLSRRLGSLAAEPPPGLWPAEALDAALSRLRRLARSGAEAEARRQALASLAPSPALHRTPDLEALLARLLTLSGRVRTPAARLKALAPLAPLPPALGAEPARTAGLSGLLDRLGQESGRFRRLSARRELLSGLAPAPVPADLEPLARVAGDLAQALARAEALSRDLAQREAALARAEARIAARLAELGRCPLCGGGLDPRAFLDGGTHDG